MYNGGVTAGVKTLNQGKNIEDASRYIERTYISSKVIGYIIGTNDLSTKSAESTADECKNLLKKTKLLLPHAHIILYEIPTRKNPESKWPGFENRRIKYIQIMSHFCDLEGHVMVKSSLTEQHICLDQLHPLWREERHIVRDIKLAVNNIPVIQCQIPNIAAQTYQGVRQTTNYGSFFCGPRGGIAPHHGFMQAPPIDSIEQYPHCQKNYPHQMVTQDQLVSKKHHQEDDGVHISKA